MVGVNETQYELDPYSFSKDISYIQPLLYYILLLFFAPKMTESSLSIKDIPTQVLNTEHK